jgi:hypothetical protein
MNAALAARERFSMRLTVEWTQTEKESKYVGPHEYGNRVRDRKTILVGKDEKTEVVDACWYAGGSLEKELVRIRPRVRWLTLKDGSGALYFSAENETPPLEVS